MPRQLLKKYLEDSVSSGGQDVWLAPDIPSGETWHLGTFGACARLGALVVLQVRTAVGPDVWQTIRAVAGPGQHEYPVDADVVGDGVARLRIVRQEKSGAAQPIVAWLEGYRMT